MDADECGSRSGQIAKALARGARVELSSSRVSTSGLDSRGGHVEAKLGCPSDKAKHLLGEVWRVGVALGTRPAERCPTSSNALPAHDAPMPIQEA